LGYARGGNNTTRRISIGYDVEFVINIKSNRIEAERDAGTTMESVGWAITNVAKNVEFSLPTDKANIPDLQSILSVVARECTARFRKPQRISAIIWETFRVYILRGVAHVVTSRAKNEMDRCAKWSGAAAR
jgi:hypothetical protein